MLTKAKLPPVAYLKQANVLTSPPGSPKRRKSISPSMRIRGGSRIIQITRRGVPTLLPLPEHLLKTFESEGRSGAKVLELENDIE